MGEYVELPGVKTWYEVEGQGEPLLLRKFLHDCLRKLAPLRCQCDDAVLRHTAVDGIERSCNDVDTEDHSRAAAVGLVVDLTVAQGRRVAIAEEA